MTKESRAPTTQPTTSFAALKQIDAGVLNVGYAEAGPAVVSALLRPRTRAGGIREVSARFCEADLADRVAALGLRRCYFRSQRSSVRQSGPRGHCDPQLPLVARPG